MASCGILAQHLVIAQPQVAPQFLEQNLNVPTPFTNRHDLSTVQLCFIGCKQTVVFQLERGRLETTSRMSPIRAKRPSA